MKNIKRIIILLVICCCFSFVNVEAITKEELQEHDSITIPMLLTSKGSKITVSDTTNYELYAQWIKISSDTRVKIYEKELECNDAESYDEYGACFDEYYEIIPDYDDDKWEKLTDDLVYLPQDGDKEHYVLYVKLEDKQNNITDYDLAVTEYKVDEDSSAIIDESKEQSPQTGDLDMLVFAGAVIICAGVAVLAYRKRFN